MSKKLLVAGDVVIDQITQDLQNPSNSDELHFGGCGGNIAAYSGLLGTDTTLRSIAGGDFTEPGGYADFLHQLNVNTDNVLIYRRQQIRRNLLQRSNNGEYDKIRGEDQYFSLGLSIEKRLILTHSHILLTVGHPHRLVTWADSCIKAQKPFYFDLSNNAGRLEPEDIVEISRHSVALMLNKSEAEVLQDRTRKNLQQYLKTMQRKTQNPFIVVTSGQDGATYYTPNDPTGIQIISPFILTDQELEQGDTLGCGDAFRAGLMNVLMNEGTLPNAIFKGHEMGANARKHIGAQGYIHYELDS